MFSSQAIAPKYANVYASFDAIWLDPSGVVAGNSGLAEPRPDLIYMGSGSLMPPKITEERGIWLSGGQYCYADHDFDADEPFSIAVFTDSPMAAAGWLAATFRSDTNRGVRFGASAAGTLVATLQNAGGSITQTATGLQASREKRLYVLTYDGSGSAAGLRMHVDDLTLTSVSGGTTVAGSLSSGKPLSFGAQNDGVNPSQFLLGRLYAVAVYPHVLDAAMRGMLRAKMSRDVHASSPARYPGYDPIWTPIDLVQPGDSWLMTNLDGAGGVTTAADPVTGAWTPANAALSNPTPGVLRVAQDGTAVNATANNVTVYTAGHRILLSVPVRGDGFASARAFDGVGFYFDDFPAATGASWVTKSGERTVPANALRLYSTINPSAAGRYIDYDLNTWTHKNLSINQLTCKGNLGNLAQATAAIMPWSSDADAPTSVRVNGKRVVYGDGSTDYTAAGFLNFMHDGSGGTLALVIDPSSVSGGHFLSATAAAAVGMLCRTNAGNTISYILSNGSGVYSVNVTSAALGAGRVPVIVRMNGGAYSVRANGVQILSGATGAVAAGNSLIPPRFYPPTSGSGNTFAISRYITDAETLKLEAYLRSYYAL